MDNRIFSVESKDGSLPVFGDRVRLVDAYPVSELTEIEPARGGHEHVIADTRWHCGFDFRPKRGLTPAERERFEDAVIAAARGFLDSLPDDLDAPPVTVPTIGFTTERIVRVSPVPAFVAKAPEGATFTIEDDGQRYLGVPARIVNGAVEFVVSRAAMRLAIEEP